MLAADRARHMTSFKPWCRADRPAPALDDKPRSPLASTGAPHGHWCGSQMLAPSRRPTAVWTALSSTAWQWQCMQPVAAVWCRHRHQPCLVDVVAQAVNQCLALWSHHHLIPCRLFACGSTWWTWGVVERRPYIPDGGNSCVSAPGLRTAK